LARELLMEHDWYQPTCGHSDHLYRLVVTIHVPVMVARICATASMWLPLQSVG
jgi:hypothetical protein